jgi:hypothetical protein
MEYLRYLGIEWRAIHQKVSTFNFPDVRGVLRMELNELVGYTVLAAKVREWACHSGPRFGWWFWE